MLTILSAHALSTDQAVPDAEPILNGGFHSVLISVSLAVRRCGVEQAGHGSSRVGAARNVAAEVAGRAWGLGGGDSEW